MFNKSRIFPVLIALIVTAIVLSACLPADSTATTAAQISAPTTPVPTAAPLKTLVVCLGEEPESLYLYSNPSSSAWSVLEGIYEGPVDTVNYQPEPVILDALPTLDNGGVELSAVEVNAGDLVANTEGDIVALSKGVKVFPENCSNGDCAVEYDGTSTLRITQMSATFKLKTGITWSDGTALTGDDSVFSYAVASDPSTPSAKNLTSKTASYTALDAQTVKWTGKPGYLTQNPAAFFFSPLPRHQLNTLSAEDLISSTISSRNPMGWGPYMLNEWVAGDHIRMVKNPNYFRAAEGLPKYDVVVFRFLGSTPETNLSALLSGECDVLDPSINLDGQYPSLLDLQQKGALKAYFGQGPEWESLNFGIKPASYDDTYNPWADRQDFFGDVRTRQAVTYCIDRSQLNQDLFAGQSAVPASYLPPNHPFLDSNLSVLPYDPHKGMALLDEVGWKDNDGDPSTPRISAGVPNVLDGTAFSVTYTAAESDLHSWAAESIAASLGACGIEVKTNLLPVSEAYAAAPDGVIFGRKFDLAELAWTVGRFPPCYLFSSSEIPTAKNAWLGTKFGGVNFTGYANPAYDKACRALLSAGLSSEIFSSASAQTQEILNTDLPAIPLFYHVHVLVVKPEICRAGLDVSSRSAMENIEVMETSQNCK